MAAYGWRKDYSVMEWLLEEGHRFDFFQAIRLLQMEHDKNPSVGETAEPEKEVVRFSSMVDFAFPASDIAAIHSDPENNLTRVVVNFLTLAGANGVLPSPHSELIVEREALGDSAMREFLDIFNHRLISLLYRIRKNHRIGFDHTVPGEDLFSQYMYALIGLGTKHLRKQMESKHRGLKSRSLLHYTGLLAQQPRSMVGLETLLADYFQRPTKNGSEPLPIKGAQFCGQWLTLDDDQITRIGASGQNQRLGTGTVVLGRRVWDQQAKLELRIGPLPYRRFVDFLPVGRAFRQLCELTRFYVGDDLEFSVRLILKAANAPSVKQAPDNSSLRLGRKNGPRLGWTSWLKSKNWRTSEDDDQVRIASIFIDWAANRRLRAKQSAKNGA